MASIKRLPEAIRTSLRSAILLYDLTRVVEELVFNSLDAGATKVSVHVGIGNCYVKVVDDGSGISRDGLSLLGERYATSKLRHFADNDPANLSFGYRGEALASISDVSLLEIITKVCGKPNGYRKVMKGLKCLYLGIDDDRKDVGTTVVVHDLFYNQPVRRRCMQSSPKKTLYSVKKCILRIALVHSNVIFRVVDVERDDELLCTRPYSALSLMSSELGIKGSSSLLELNFSDGVLKLSGYVSYPCDSVVGEAFQYVYVNSRFVHNSPIHKLLNHMTTRSECLDVSKANRVSQKGKRSRPQGYSAYIVNLGCPLSLYDLTLEPSETYVEFKDWIPILSFIEKAIQDLWKRISVCGGCLSPVASTSQNDDVWKNGGDIMSTEEDSLEYSEFAIKRCKIPSSPLKVPSKEVNLIFSKDQELYVNFSEFKQQKADLEFVDWHGCSYPSWNGSLSRNLPTITQNSESNLSGSEKNNVLFPDDYFLGDRFTVRERSSDLVEGHVSRAEWHNESHKIDSMINESSTSMLSLNCHNFSNELDILKSSKKTFLQRCSSGRYLPPDLDLFASDEGSGFPINGLKTKRRRVCASENVDILNTDVSTHSFGISPGTLLQNEASYAQKFPIHGMGIDLSTSFELLAGASAESLSSHVDLNAEKKALGSDAKDGHMEQYGLGHYMFNTGWSSVIPDTLFHAFEHLPENNGHDWRMRLDKRAYSWDFAYDTEKEGKVSEDVVSKSVIQDGDVSSCTRVVLDFDNYANARKDNNNFLLQENHLHNEFSSEYNDVSITTDWLFSDSHSKFQKNNYKYEGQGDWLRCQDLEQDPVPKEKSKKRSCSAPPFYTKKMRFISLSNQVMKEGNAHTPLFHDIFTSPEAGKLKHQIFQSKCEANLMRSRPGMKNEPDIMLEFREFQKGENFEQALDSPIEGFACKKILESIVLGTKWQNGHQEVAVGNSLCNIDTRHNILDISSGFLHFAGNLLVPESIHKSCLEDAKVLQQVDKKFIPVVAGGTLAIIDQHAADERIRLEELRQKVLSGEAKTTTYLDAEQQLILPELEYQLLQNYAEQIRDWGWVCENQAQGSGTFNKNLNTLHQHSTVVTLLAVPCILGVNLSDGDLLEFLQQLTDTDGSSMMPSSVLRVLNYKACRGAIMFGDSLLPSECSLIVEELKQTSLCFQCAHGRPTTVPLVNLEELHRQIAKLGGSGDGSSEWRGFRKQEISLERASGRLTLGKC